MVERTPASGGPSVSSAATDETVHFVLDGQPATARKGEMLIAAAERAGTFIPRFCYHPRMKSVGVCRMCLVEVSGPRGATLQPSCFVAVGEGMEVDTRSEKVKKAQDGVLEFLLVNHPLDCPVCDKGGECPLQDQTFAYGPGESRFIEEKRHFEKPIAISELVLLDRERCIQCSRCTRFAEDVAGVAQIDFAGRGELVEVATFPGEPFSSYFSGNTVQICPVGALTATPYRFTARPWDLDQVESTCTTCSFGCRVAVQSSANRLTRLLGIDSDPVNHGWLCDKGRFVFESTNGDEVATGPAPAIAVATAADEVDVVPATASQAVSLGPTRGQFAGEARSDHSVVSNRLTEPLVRKGGELVPTSWGEALGVVAEHLGASKSEHGAGSIGVLGGARLTNEGAYAWAKLAKGILGTDSVDAQLGDGLPAELVFGLPRATIDEACDATTVVLLAGDVREELPVLFLRLRDSVTNGHTKLLEISPVRTSLSAYAAVSLRVRPGDSPAVAASVVREGAPSLFAHPEGPTFSAEDLAAARALLAAPEGGRPGDGVVVVLGRPSLAEGAQVTAAAAAALAEALPGARFLPALRRGNVFGALEMGLAPGLLPGRVSLDAGREWFAAAWGGAPEAAGLDADGILSALAGEGEAPGSVTSLVLLGADPLTDFPDADLAVRALGAADFVVAVAGHPSPSTAHADVVLPAAVAHERVGTTTNIEGRVSRLGQKLVPPGQAWSDWMIAAELAQSLGADLGFGGVADLESEIAALAPSWAGFTPAVLDHLGAHDGLVVPLGADRGTGRAPIPTDPIAIPGVESVEHQGAALWVGLIEPLAGEGRPDLAGAQEKPAVGAGVAWRAETPRVPAPDSYSLRLVATRRLYDRGSAVASSPSLVALVPDAVARANPYDLDRIGATSGDRVRIRSARGAIELAVDADVHVARGVLAVDFNVGAGDGPANVAASLIEAGAAVNDVRLESLA